MSSQAHRIAHDAAFAQAAASVLKLEELKEKMERGKLEKADLKLAKVLFVYICIYIYIYIYIYTYIYVCVCVCVYLYRI